MNPTKIKPVLHYRLLIKDSYDLNNFSKKRYNTSRTLFVKTNPYEPSNREVFLRIQQRLRKILKILKFVETASLQNCEALRNGNIRPSTMVWMIKKLSNVQVLSLSDLVPQNAPLFLEDWIKPAKKLKEITYSAQSCHHFNSYCNKTRSSFSVKKIKLKRLYISCAAKFARNITKPCFTLQTYPDSLEKLAICCHNEPAFEENIQKDNFSQITNLQSLQFALNSQSEPLEPYLKMLPNPIQLRTLSLSFNEADQVVDSYAITKMIRSLTQLQDIRLDFRDLPDTLDAFLEALKDRTLVSFSLKGYIRNKEHVSSLMGFLPCLTNLETLELDLGNGIYNQYLIDCLITDIGECILRQKNLKSVSIKRSMSDTLVTYLKLIAVITGKTPALQKLKIVFGGFNPNKEQFKEIVKFLQGLEMIEVLELDRLNIQGNKFFQEIVNVVLNMKNLRILALREIQVTRPRNLFVNNVESILTKRGFERFTCTIQADFALVLLKKGKDNKYINKNYVKMKNPFFEELEINAWGNIIYEQDKRLVHDAIMKEY